MASSSKKNAFTNGSAVSENHSTDTGGSLLPHLESLERIIKLPVVGAAWDKGQDVYGKVKGRNRVFNWALSAAEDCVTRAVNTAAPIVLKLDGPIQYVDQTLVKGINKLEVKAPIIKDTPQEIYNQAVNKVIDVVQPHIDRVAKLKAVSQQKACSLKDLAWQKANEVLATQYGSLAVNGVDTTTALAERLLEYYFPKYDPEEEDSSSNAPKQTVCRKNQEDSKATNTLTGEDEDMPVPASEDPVLHTVQTVGRLSNKISRRVYRNVSRQIRKMQKGNINDYLSSLIAALKLHQYINFINSSMGTTTNLDQSILNSNDNANTMTTTTTSTLTSLTTATTSTTLSSPTTMTSSFNSTINSTTHSNAINKNAFGPANNSAHLHHNSSNSKPSHKDKK